jgi:putative transposase
VHPNQITEWNRQLRERVAGVFSPVASKIAITLEACHAVDVLQEAFSRYGTLEIVNTDQGSQLTAIEFVTAVKDRGCKLSMGGR